MTNIFSRSPRKAKKTRKVDISEISDPIPEGDSQSPTPLPENRRHSEPLLRPTPIRTDSRRRASAPATFSSPYALFTPAQRLIFQYLLQVIDGNPDITESSHTFLRQTIDEEKLHHVHELERDAERHVKRDIELITNEKAKDSE